MNWQILNVGDVVPLKTVLGNIVFMGVVTDPDVPNQFSATMEMYGDTAVVTVPILQGPKGDPGEPTFALRFQNDSLADVPDPDHLPNLTSSQADIGKYWIFKELDENGNAIGTSMFVWYGTEYRQMPVGSQGPPGPYPIIRPRLIAEPPMSNNGPNGERNWIEVDGNVASPQWDFHAAFPEGPQGLPGQALGQAGDVDLFGLKPGDHLVCSTEKNIHNQYIWKPETPKFIVPSIYTVPHSAFNSFAGITGDDRTICTFQVPQQIFWWKPWVMGHLRVFGAQLDPTPLLIGCNVRLGHPTTGPIVASGHGNAWGSIELIPHTSSNSKPNEAMTPTNALGRVTKDHTGTEGTLYVNLINEGFASLFDFNRMGAQLSVMAVPVQPPAA